MAWLAIALISGTVAGYQYFAEGWQSALWMLFITGVSVGMYLLRRRQRMNMEDRS